MAVSAVGSDLAIFVYQPRRRFGACVAAGHEWLGATGAAIGLLADDGAKILEVPVSINISGRHFPSFVMEKQFHRLLKLPALQAAKIVFEITESVFVDSNPSTEAGLKRLREAGVDIWLDDFGEGYSSFRYLAHFPVDGIKISESFVKNCEKEEKSRVILSSLQTLARGLGVCTVVEGIENRMQLETLKTMGFDAVQGYYLSKPLAAKDIPGLFSAAAKPKSRKTNA